MPSFKRLYGLGYTHIHPIIPVTAPLAPGSAIKQTALGKIPGKPLDRQTNGKQQWASYGWNKFNPTIDDINDWETITPPLGAPFIGIGFKGSQYPAVDIDVLEGVHSAKIRDIFLEYCGTAPTRTGRAPKCMLIYKSANPLTYRRLKFTLPNSKLPQLVELISNNKQWVGFGVHPQTSKPYTWDRELPPAIELTELTDEALDKAFHEVELYLELVGASFHTTKERLPSSRVNIDQASLAAPLFDLVQMMVEEADPNAPNLNTRPGYIKFIIAIAGAAGLGLDKIANDFDFVDEVEELVVNWASGWEGNGELEFDENDVRCDFGRVLRTAPYGLGWEYLVLEAERAGSETAKHYIKEEAMRYLRVIEDEELEAITPEELPAAFEYADDEDALMADLGEPVPLDTAISRESPEFDLSWLPDCMADVVRDEATRIQAPAEMIALPMMVAMAGCIGKAARMAPQARGDWEERICLWGFTIAGPGSMKTATLNAGYRSLYKIEDEKTKVHKGVHDLWKSQKAEADKRVKGWERVCENVMKKDGPNAPLPDMPESVRDLPPEPIPPRYVVQDTTVEKLAKIMVDSKGLSLVRDELSGWVYNMGRYNTGSDRQFYLECYSGGRYTVDRVNAGSDIFISDLYLNIYGTIQPDIAKAIFGDDRTKVGDDGFSDRFSLIAAPNLSKHAANEWVIYDDTADLDARERLDIVSRILAEADWPTVLKGNAARFTPEAQTAFDKWLTVNMNTLRRNQESSIAGFMNKSRATVIKLALMFHLVDWADEQEFNPQAVTLRALQKAIGFMDGFLVPTWECIKGQFSRTPITEAAMRIAYHVHAEKLSCVRTATILAKDWKGLKERATVEKALDELVARDWLLPPMRVISARGGRPSLTYKVNPRVFGLDFSVDKR